MWRLPTKPAIDVPTARQNMNARFSHPARLASRWCSRPQAMAAAEPYRVVWVLVVTAGAGQGCFPASRNAAPCRTGRPFAPCSRAGAGKYMTRSLRSQAEHLDREITQQPGQPDQVIAGVEDDQDVRVAVVPVPGRNEPADHLADLGGGDLGRIIGRASRTASSGSVQEVRPGSSATTSEYGQPGISCAFPS